jgi:hypothetical protein
VATPGRGRERAERDGPPGRGPCAAFFSRFDDFGARCSCRTARAARPWA